MAGACDMHQRSEHMISMGEAERKKRPFREQMCERKYIKMDLK
jgi:hypothetical protein